MLRSASLAASRSASLHRLATRLSKYPSATPWLQTAALSTHATPDRPSARAEGNTISTVLPCLTEHTFPSVVTRSYGIEYKKLSGSAAPKPDASDKVTRMRDKFKTMYDNGEYLQVYEMARALPPEVYKAVMSKAQMNRLAKNLIRVNYVSEAYDLALLGGPEEINVKNLNTQLVTVSRFCHRPSAQGLEACEPLFMVLDKLAEHGLKPNSHTHALILRSMAQFGAAKEAMERLKELEEQGVELGRSVYSSLAWGIIKHDVTPNRTTLEMVEYLLEGMQFKARDVQDPVTHNDAAVLLWYSRNMDVDDENTTPWVSPMYSVPRELIFGDDAAVKEWTEFCAASPAASEELVLFNIRFQSKDLWTNIQEIAGLYPKGKKGFLAENVRRHKVDFSTREPGTVDPSQEKALEILKQRYGRIYRTAELRSCVKFLKGLPDEVKRNLPSDVYTKLISHCVKWRQWIWACEVTELSRLSMPPEAMSDSLPYTHILEQASRHANNVTELNDIVMWMERRDLTPSPSAWARVVRVQASAASGTAARDQLRAMGDSVTPLARISYCLGRIEAGFKHKYAPNSPERKAVFDDVHEQLEILDPLHPDTYLSKELLRVFMWHEFHSDTPRFDEAEQLVKRFLDSEPDYQMGRMIYRDLMKVAFRAKSPEALLTCLRESLEQPIASHDNVLGDASVITKSAESLGKVATVSQIVEAAQNVFPDLATPINHYLFNKFWWRLVLQYSMLRDWTEVDNLCAFMDRHEGAAGSITKANASYIHRSCTLAVAEGQENTALSLILALSHDESHIAGLVKMFGLDAKLAEALVRLCEKFNLDDVIRMYHFPHLDTYGNFEANFRRRGIKMGHGNENDTDIAVDLSFAPGRSTLASWKRAIAAGDLSSVLNDMSNLDPAWYKAIPPSVLRDIESKALEEYQWKDLYELHLSSPYFTRTDVAFTPIDAALDAISSVIPKDAEQREALRQGVLYSEDVMEERGVRPGASTYSRQLRALARIGLPDEAVEKMEVTIEGLGLDPAKKNLTTLYAGLAVGLLELSERSLDWDPTLPAAEDVISQVELLCESMDVATLRPKFLTEFTVYATMWHARRIKSVEKAVQVFDLAEQRGDPITDGQLYLDSLELAVGKEDYANIANFYAAAFHTLGIESPHIPSLADRLAEEFSKTSFDTIRDHLEAAGLRPDPSKQGDVSQFQPAFALVWSALIRHVAKRQNWDLMQEILEYLQPIPWFSSMDEGIPSAVVDAVAADQEEIALSLLERIQSASGARTLVRLCQENEHVELSKLMNLCGSPRAKHLLVQLEKVAKDVTQQPKSIEPTHREALLLTNQVDDLISDDEPKVAYQRILEAPEHVRHRLPVRIFFKLRQSLISSGDWELAYDSVVVAAPDYRTPKPFTLVMKDISMSRHPGSKVREGILMSIPKMREHGVTPDAWTYATLLRGLATHSFIDDAHKLLKELRSDARMRQPQHMVSLLSHYGLGLIVNGVLPKAEIYKEVSKILEAIDLTVLANVKGNTSVVMLWKASQDGLAAYKATLNHLGQLGFQIKSPRRFLDGMLIAGREGDVDAMIDFYQTAIAFPKLPPKLHLDHQSSATRRGVAPVTDYDLQSTLCKLLIQELDFDHLVGELEAKIPAVGPDSTDDFAFRRFWGRAPFEFATKSDWDSVNKCLDLYERRETKFMDLEYPCRVRWGSTIDIALSAGEIDIAVRMMKLLVGSGVRRRIAKSVIAKSDPEINKVRELCETHGLFEMRTEIDRQWLKKRGSRPSRLGKSNYIRPSTRQREREEAAALAAEEEAAEALASGQYDEADLTGHGDGAGFDTDEYYDGYSGGEEVGDESEKQ